MRRMTCIAVAGIFFFTASWCYALKSQIRATAQVGSFGNYSFRTYLEKEITKPGEQAFLTITVDGMYNGEYPWVMRIYTDNREYSGSGTSFNTQVPQGLISQDGKYFIPLQASCPGWGDGVWRAIPDVNESDYIPYKRPALPGEQDYNECIIMGIDPGNATWVAGQDKTLFTTDDNILGDTTIATPFDILVKGTFDQKAVQGKYTGKIYVEIIPSP